MKRDATTATNADQATTGGRNKPAVATGLYFIVAGLLLLLDQLGIIPVSIGVLLALGLVALGAGVIMDAPDRRKRAEKKHDMAHTATSGPAGTSGATTTDDAASASPMVVDDDGTVEVEILAEEPNDTAGDEAATKKTGEDDDTSA